MSGGWDAGLRALTAGELPAFDPDADLTTNIAVELRSNEEGGLQVRASFEPQFSILVAGESQCERFKILRLIFTAACALGAFDPDSRCDAGCDGTCV